MGDGDVTDSERREAARAVFGSSAILATLGLAEDDVRAGITDLLDALCLARRKLAERDATIHAAHNAVRNHVAFNEAQDAQDVGTLAERIARLRGNAECECDNARACGELNASVVALASLAREGGGR